MKLIALHGLPRSGKDTIADYLVGNYEFGKESFAAGLYREVAKAFRVTIEQLQSHEWKTTPQHSMIIANCQSPAFISSMVEEGMLHRDLNKPRTSRDILQLWGTEYRRQQQKDYWCKALAGRLRSAYAAWNTVITDVRFSDEAEVIKSLGGHIWLIKRPTCIHTGHISDDPLPLKYISAILLNDDSIKKLYTQVDILMENINGKIITG